MFVLMPVTPESDRFRRRFEACLHDAQMTQDQAALHMGIKASQLHRQLHGEGGVWGCLLERMPPVFQEAWIERTAEDQDIPVVTQRVVARALRLVGLDLRLRPARARLAEEPAFTAPGRRSA